MRCELWVRCSTLLAGGIQQRLGLCWNWEGWWREGVGNRSVEEDE